MESVPSSRSTSGTHSQTSEATDATGITSIGDLSISPRGLKSTGASTVQLHEQPQLSTPRASTSQVNGTAQATLAPVVPQPAPPAPPPTLRFHLGAVDQSALTSRPPHEVFAEVRRALAEMGVEARKEREEDFKLECVRRKRAKTLIGATQGLGTSIRTSVFPPSQADLQRSTRSPSISGGAGSGFASASASSGPGGSIRNFLRRGSQQNTSFAGAEEDAAAAAQAAAPPQPLYGEASVDGGQEVRFSVEVTQIKNLAGLYSLDIRRMKGNLWAYKFLYHALLERCELGSGPRRVAA
jgi:protein-serine/threonine kinase